MDDQLGFENGFEETQKAERALSKAENFENDFLAGGYESPSFGSEPGTPAGDPQGAPMEKRNYEKYLDGEALEPANPFEMPRFEPGGFEGNQGNTGEFNTLGSIPVAPTPPNPYSNNSDNGYNVPPAGNNYNMNGANFEGLEEPMSMGEWFVCMLIMMVPCVNIVMMFVWAFSKNEKKSKSNFYKVQLIVMGVILALYMILGLIFVGAGVGLASLSMR